MTDRPSPPHSLKEDLQLLKFSLFTLSLSAHEYHVLTTATARWDIK